METFSALLAICAGNSPVTGEFHAQRPVTGSFHVFFDLRLNKRFSKQWQAWWFETPSHPLWRHCNDVSRRPISLTCCSSIRNIEEDFLFSQSNFAKKIGRCQNMYMTHKLSCRGICKEYDAHFHLKYYRCFTYGSYKFYLNDMACYLACSITTLLGNLLTTDN